jgi:hypothetical protein
MGVWNLAALHNPSKLLYASIPLILDLKLMYGYRRQCCPALRHRKGRRESAHAVGSAGAAVPAPSMSPIAALAEVATESTVPAAESGATPLAAAAAWSMPCAGRGGRGRERASEAAARVGARFADARARDRVH